MNIPAIFRRGVKTIERIAGSVRLQVVHKPVTGRDAYGPTYGAPVTREAFVEFVSEDVTQEDGTVATSSAKLTFMEPIGVHHRDSFTIPDSRGGTMELNVKAVKAPMDVNGTLYFAEVYLGD